MTTKPWRHRVYFPYEMIFHSPGGKIMHLMRYLFKKFSLIFAYFNTEMKIINCLICRLIENFILKLFVSPVFAISYFKILYSQESYA